MKNRRKQGKIFRSLLAVLMLTAMLVTSVLQPVFAGDYEAGKTGNLTLTVQQADEEGNQTPLPNVGLTIYKVGSVNFDGNVHFVLDEALAAAAIDFDSITTADGWYEAAGQLADMISSGSVDVWGLSRTSDAEGNITVTDLAEGMYLVVQTDANSSVAVSPMLISVPFADQELGWMRYRFPASRYIMPWLIRQSSFLPYVSSLMISLSFFCIIAQNHSYL